MKDTGIGISEEVLAYIFDEFRRVDRSISRRFEERGLGLAIAKKIMLILGGNISVKSKPGEESDLTINLPVRIQSGPTNELHKKPENYNIGSSKGDGDTVGEPKFYFQRRRTCVV